MIEEQIIIAWEDSFAERRTRGRWVSGCWFRWRSILCVQWYGILQSVYPSPMGPNRSIDNSTYGIGISGGPGLRHRSLVLNWLTVVRR